MTDPITVARAVASLGTSLLRVNRGLMVKGNRGAPAKTLQLFEAEYCPYCRHVREALTERHPQIDVSRLEAVGRGWEEPASTNSDLNRRVEVQWFTLE